MKVKYYGRDLTGGHRDGACFEVETDNEQSPTGKNYTTYWLTDSEGNRAPESVYIELERGINND